MYLAWAPGFGPPGPVKRQEFDPRERGELAWGTAGPRPRRAPGALQEQRGIGAPPGGRPSANNELGTEFALPMARVCPKPPQVSVAVWVSRSWSQL